MAANANAASQGSPSAPTRRRLPLPDVVASANKSICQGLRQYACNMKHVIQCPRNTVDVENDEENENEENDAQNDLCRRRCCREVRQALDHLSECSQKNRRLHEVEVAVGGRGVADGAGGLVGLALQCPTCRPLMVMLGYHAKKCRRPVGSCGFPGCAVLKPGMTAALLRRRQQRENAQQQG